MNVRIEEAKPSDAAAIIAFMNHVGGESDNLTFGKDEFFIKDPVDEASLIECQREQGGAFFLAWHDRARKKGGPRLVGFLSIDMGARPRLRHRGVLCMAVLEECWNEGIGTRLLQRAIAWAEDNQALEVLSLEVRTDNERALRLYERFGFERTGTNRGLLKVNDVLYDTYLMSRIR